MSGDNQTDLRSEDTAWNRVGDNQVAWIRHWRLAYHNEFLLLEEAQPNVVPQLGNFRLRICDLAVLAQGAVDIVARLLRRVHRLGETVSLSPTPRAHLQNGAQRKQPLGRALSLNVDDFRQAIVGLLRLVDFQIQHADFGQHLRVFRCQTVEGRYGARGRGVCKKKGKQFISL